MPHSTSSAALDIGVFIPPNLAHSNSSWAASLINVCNNQNTWALQCVSGYLPSPSTTCGSNAPTITITEAITDFTYATQTTTAGSVVSITETCTFSEAASASCVASYEISAHGSTTQSATTALLTDITEFSAYVFPIDITAGASKLHSASADVCHSSGTAGRTSITALMGSFLFMSVLLICMM